MNIEKARQIQFIAQMAEHDDAQLMERELAQLGASEEIAQAYTEQLPAEAELPAYFNDALWYATSFVYKAKTPSFHPDDVKREIARQLGYRREDDDSWHPTTDDQMAVAMDLIHVATQLADRDDVPAFGPHIGGRPSELMDDPGSQYNKFGTLIYPR